MMQMTDQEATRTYEQLAQLYDRQGQGKLRDWFLVLAADSAYNVGNENEAERLRSQLLAVNPHHLLKPFASIMEALKSPDIQSYVADLRRTYPPDTASQLLRTQVPNSPQPETPRSNQYLGFTNASDSTLDMAFGADMAAQQPATKPVPIPRPQPQNPPQSIPSQVQPKESRTSPQTQTPSPTRIPHQTPATQRPQTQTAPSTDSPQTKSHGQPKSQPQPRSQPQPKKPQQSPPKRTTPAPLPSAPVSNSDGATNGIPKPSASSEPTPIAADSESATSMVSYWMSTVLFVIVFTSGLLLGAYTFAKPFLPENFLGLR
ncbi:MAG: hypothetical protein ACFCD0_21905 [Gemmataceae bacterium]